MTMLRLLGPILLAIVAAAWIDRSTASRGLDPPLFRLRFDDGDGPRTVPLAMFRRGLALTGLTLVLWIGVFGPLGLIGQETVVDYDSVPTVRLFELHFYFLLFVFAWYALGFTPRRPVDPGREVDGWTFAEQIGLRAERGRGQGEGVRSIAREIGVGLLFGVAGWLVVLTILLLVGSLVWMIGGEGALPAQPPEMVHWIVGLPWFIRLGISLSAGVVEEIFFRGLLQPRCGIAFSTVLFALAHAGYQQPLMLVGVTLLSLFFAALVVWRQSLWAAITAHTVFDAIQLLVVIPSVTKVLPGGSPIEGIDEIVSWVPPLLVWLSAHC